MNFQSPRYGTGSSCHQASLPPYAESRSRIYQPPSRAGCESTRLDYVSGSGSVGSDPAGRLRSIPLLHIGPLEGRLRPISLRTEARILERCSADELDRVDLPRPRPFVTPELPFVLARPTLGDRVGMESPEIISENRAFSYHSSAHTVTSPFDFSRARDPASGQGAYHRVCLGLLSPVSRHGLGGAQVFTLQQLGRCDSLRA